MRLPDWLFRFAYRYGIKLARVWWRLRGRRTSAAHVFVWHQGRVLLLRTSYSTGWTMPGGVIKRGESPIDAAIREASEEVGLKLTATDLRPVGIVEHSPDYRRDQGHFFEVQLERWPEIRIDNREIVEARFVTLDDASSFAMARVFRDYFTRKAAEQRRS
jgi:8-oxo-dGTP pyrophosphatase MutT (NUDIX family)